MRLTIPVVLGSIRKERRSERAARLLAERVAAAGHDAPLVDLKELALPLYDGEDHHDRDPSVRRWRAIAEASDASVWLTPEYNHAYTSAIKNAVDYLGAELRRKPAVVCGLSSGLMGGARAVEQFKLVLIEFHAIPLGESVYFPDAAALFGPDGALQRPEHLDRIDDVVADLVWYARTLKWGRDNVPLPRRKRD